MKKLVISILLVACLSLPACKSVPDSVKEADKASIELDASAVKNTEAILAKVLAAYAEEAIKNIEFRAEVAKRLGKSDEEIAAFKKEKKDALLAQIKKVQDKHAEVKSDWKASLNLRLKISEFLENKQGVKDIIDSIIKELNNE